MLNLQFNYGHNLKYLILLLNLMLSMGYSQDFVLECVGSSMHEEIEAKYYPQIAKLLELGEDLNQVDKKPEAEKLKLEIEKSICDAYGFRNVYITLLRYSQEGIYVTIDIVKKDAKPFPFLSEPKGHYSDPDGVLAEWDEYLRLSLQLFLNGEIANEDIQRCEGVWHIIFGHSHPKLSPYLDLFQKKVRLHQAALEEIFLDDADANKRASAAFLLAYIEDGQRLADILSKRLYDGDAEVRNNVMRVMGYILKDHPCIELPVEEIAVALSFPTVLDRNKAVCFLYLLSQNPQLLAQYRTLLIEQIPLLVKMQQQKQPNINGPAAGILKILKDIQTGY